MQREFVMVEKALQKFAWLLGKRADPSAPLGVGYFDVMNLRLALPMTESQCQAISGTWYRSLDEAEKIEGKKSPRWAKELLANVANLLDGVCIESPPTGACYLPPWESQPCVVNTQNQCIGLQGTQWLEGKPCP